MWPEQKIKTLKERFEEVEKMPLTECGCEIWLGTTQNMGYGVVSDYAGPYKKQRYLAHRVAWTIENGPIPEGLNVLHS